MKIKDKCIKCGKDIWVGNKYRRNFWKIYCEEHQKISDEEFKRKFQKTMEDK